MKKCKLHTVIMFLFVAVLLSSCTIPLSCKLYNNTTMPIQVIQVDYHGQEKHFSLMPKESVTLSIWSRDLYVINSKNIRWNYDPPSHIHSEYYEFVGFGPFTKRLVRAQLNEDGRIFVIKDGLNFPIIPDSFEQPKRYPLVPIDLAELKKRKCCLSTDCCP